jgi:hypothetical protein
MPIRNPKRMWHAGGTRNAQIGHTTSLLAQQLFLVQLSLLMQGTRCMQDEKDVKYIEGAILDSLAAGHYSPILSLLPCSALRLQWQRYFEVQTGQGCTATRAESGARLKELTKKLATLNSPFTVSPVECRCVVKRECRRRPAARLGANVELKHAISHYL